MITETTYRTQETVEEKDIYGTCKATYTKNITIKNINGKFYQTEKVYRNSVAYSSSQYPADTDYAKERRIAAGMEW